MPVVQVEADYGEKQEIERITIEIGDVVLLRKAQRYWHDKTKSPYEFTEAKLIKISPKGQLTFQRTDREGSPAIRFMPQVSRYRNQPEKFEEIGVGRYGQPWRISSEKQRETDREKYAAVEQISDRLRTLLKASKDAVAALESALRQGRDLDEEEQKLVANAAIVLTEATKTSV